MGFFSQECESSACKHGEITSLHAESPLWMTQVVVIEPDGRITRGTYDGYGRVIVGEAEEEVETGMGGWPTVATVWHQACWALEGEPVEYRGPSKNAENQGFFGRYRGAEPTRLRG